MKSESLVENENLVFWKISTKGVWLAVTLFGFLAPAESGKVLSFKNFVAKREIFVLESLTVSLPPFLIQ
jgi:hypothetical protein